MREAVSRVQLYRKYVDPAISVYRQSVAYTFRCCMRSAGFQEFFQILSKNVITITIFCITTYTPIRFRSYYVRSVYG